MPQLSRYAPTSSSRASFKPPRLMGGTYEGNSSNGSITNTQADALREQSPPEDAQRVLPGAASESLIPDQEVEAGDILMDSDVLMESDLDTGHGRPARERKGAEQDDDSPAVRAQAASPSKHAVPRELLVRLLHEHFKDRETRITSDAVTALATYVDLFVKEAIHRAVQERRTAATATSTDPFLEVCDLEKLAPQLLLDF